jgi:putative ABC transport system permease protein
MAGSRAMASLRERSARLRRWLVLLPVLLDDACAQLRADARRHLLTLAGIVWGSAAVIFLLATGAGFYEFLDTGFKKTGDRHTFIYGEYTTSESRGARPGRRIVLTREDVERLEASVPSAAVVAAEVIRATEPVRSAARTRSTVVSAGTPGLQYVQELHVGRGRFFDGEDDRLGRPVAVLGASLGPIFFGDRDALGQTLRIAGHPFEVIGILKKKGQQLAVNAGLHDDTVFIPLGAGNSAFGHRRAIDVVYANPRRLEDIPAMHAELRATLAPWHHIAPGDVEAVRLQSMTDFVEPFRRIGWGLQVLLGLIGTVALAMAGVGVANLMLAIVNDRRMEMAVRRACGAHRGDVLVQLLAETLVVVLAGGLIGIGLGVALALGISFAPLPEGIPTPRLSMSALLTTFSVLVVLALLAGLLPARLASRVDPSLAMRMT